MYKKGLVYVRGMNKSDAEADEDIWDDSKLNDAYDKALKMANIEVAKRVAMETNSHGNKANVKNKKGKSSFKTPSSDKAIEWKTGMPCRAIYEEDGLEYEAFLLSFVNENDCTVRFLGYENTETVPVNSLKPSLGNNERTCQIERALAERGAHGSEDNTQTSDVMDCTSEKSSSLPSSDKLYQKKKKTSKSKKKASGLNSSFELPDISMPNLSMMKNLGSMGMPIAPPPPMNLFGQDKSDSEEQAISSMLLSWYMSGYYTGLYQGMKKSKENRKSN